ncbi:MAG: (2Fe-2S)-binding protein [Alphaproteobacteria bacterium]|nr:(2Fe-2S)-binding protein [Alphaproteobacteria bacterium]
MDININGRIVTVPEKFRDVTLLEFIRSSVGLKGTKYGCGAGLCGACTVHIDGAAVRSCQTVAADAVGRRVTTIEGLSKVAPEAGLHPVQTAWIEEAVPQCGYCQPGQIMTAVALLAHDPNPSDDTIRNEMSGNLCRCGTYPRIHRAIVRAARERGNHDVRR